jgi:hypothetical protein
MARERATAACTDPISSTKLGAGEFDGDRTQEHSTMSFSRPWKLSTVLISGSGNSGGKLALTDCFSSASWDAYL